MCWQTSPCSRASPVWVPLPSFRGTEGRFQKLSVLHFLHPSHGDTNETCITGSGSSRDLASGLPGEGLARGGHWGVLASFLCSCGAIADTWYTNE